jgi:uncharacterized membrane protein
MTICTWFIVAVYSMTPFCNSFTNTKHFRQQVLDYFIWISSSLWILPLVRKMHMRTEGLEQEEAITAPLWENGEMFPEF